MSVLRGGRSIILKSTTTTKSVARLITELRDNISESEAEYFSDAKLLRWLNRAHIRVYNMIGHCFKRHFEKTTTIDLVNGTEQYDLPTDFKKAMTISRIKEGGSALTYPYKLTKVDYQDKDEYRTVYGNTLYNEYYYFVGQKIGFLPVPNTTETGAIQLEYLPFATDLSATGNIAIPQDYAELVVLWASYTALRAEDESKGRSFYRDYRELENLALFDYARRDESSPDNIRSTRWNT